MTRALVFILLSVTAVWAQTPEVVPVDKEPMHKLVLDNEYVRVFYVTVPPHGETKFHRHDRDYIFVTLGDSEVESGRVAEKPVKLSLKDGESRFTKGGFAHRAKNLSDKPFRNVTVEFKQPVNDSGRHMSSCTGTCQDMFLDSANVQCGRWTGPGGGWIGARQPALVVRAKSANTPDLVEVTTEPGRESLVSFYEFPVDTIEASTGNFEKVSTGKLGTQMDITVCEFKPLKAPTGK